MICSIEQKRKAINRSHTKISISRQCELMGLSKSTYYYNSKRDERYNLFLMRHIDEQYTRTPFYGVRRMTIWLRSQRHRVNIKRVLRLMRLMGIQAIYPKRNLSRASKAHKKYPYLLRGLIINRPDHVWGADITYIRMRYGFLYLVVVMDWFSRFVLSWELSNTLDHGFCLKALEKALDISKPEIFNTDQGVQFTCEEFTSCLEEKGISISMDGRGRVFDNIFVERLWRTVKYEEVYLNDYESVVQVREGLRKYFRFYNEERFHQSLKYRTPSNVYHGIGGSPLEEMPHPFEYTLK